MAFVIGHDLSDGSIDRALPLFVPDNSRNRTNGWIGFHLSDKRVYQAVGRHCKF
jgi:hypothetical protein